MIALIVLLVTTVARAPLTPPTPMMASPKLIRPQSFVQLVIIVLNEHQQQQHIHVLLELTMISLESNTQTNVLTVLQVRDSKICG